MTRESHGREISHWIGNLQTQLRMPNYAVPVIESVRIHYPGALTDQAVAGSFGDVIDPFGANVSSPPPGALSVESTFAEPGKVQQYTIVAGVGFSLEPEPFQATIKGNSFVMPASTTLKPVSPDAYTNDDMNAFGTATPTSANYDCLGLIPGQAFAPAILQYGWWQNYAFYYMCEAYNFVWQVGHNMTIINDPLRYTACVPSRAQEGSSSNSEVDVVSLIRRTNDYYRTIGAQNIMLGIDRTRVGYLGTASEAGVNNVGLFRASRAYDTVGATFGGIGMTAHLSKNPEFRKLSTPFILRPGVPIGLKAVVSNGDDQLNMQRQLALSCGLTPGVYPASFTEDINIAVGNILAGTATGDQPGIAGNLTNAEFSLDSPPVFNTKTTPTVRHLFKGGPFKIATNLRGWEVDEETAKALQDQTIQQIIQSETGWTMTANT
jgi:hypothetical protein